MGIRNLLATARNLVTPEDERPTRIPDRPSRAPMRSGIVLRKPRRIPTGRKHVLLISELQSTIIPEATNELVGMIDVTPIYLVANDEPEPIGQNEEGLEIFSTGVLECAVQRGYDVWLVNDSRENLVDWWDPSDIADEQVIDAFDLFKGSDAERVREAMLFLYSRFGLTDYINQKASWRALYESLPLHNIGSGIRIPERIFT